MLLKISAIYEWILLSKSLILSFLGLTNLDSLYKIKVQHTQIAPAITKFEPNMLRQ